MEKDEIVLVPVPRSRLHDVYRTLASEPEHSAYVDIEANWDLAAIATLWGGSDVSARTLMKHLAQHAGEEVHVEDVKRVLGEKSGRAVGGVVSSLHRRCRARLRRGLPFEKRWDPQRGSRYVMAPAIADMINEVR